MPNFYFQWWAKLPFLDSFLDTEIYHFNEQEALTIGQACEGVQIFGGIGSGKTSGSGEAIARALPTLPHGSKLCVKTNGQSSPPQAKHSVPLTIFTVCSHIHDASCMALGMTNLAAPPNYHSPSQFHLASVPKGAICKDFPCGKLSGKSGTDIFPYGAIRLLSGLKICGCFLGIKTAPRQWGK